MGIAEDFKIPVERIVYFVAALIPGGVALLIYQSASGTGLQWLFDVGFLGYKTKLGLLIFIAFVIGHTITNFVREVLDDLLPILAELVGRMPWPSKASFQYENGPWRSVEWRNAIKGRLGSSAPDDLKFITQQMMAQELNLATSLPPEQQGLELLRISREQTASILNDMEWSALYSHYHVLAVQLRGQANYDEVTTFIRDGFTYNFVAAALYVLASALVAPSVRHWWFLLPAAAWIFAFLLFLVARIRRHVADQWSTLPDQISYLVSGQI